MNDTTRDELREDVADAFRAFVSEMGGGEDWSQAYYDHADRTIALVTAARDAEIRELLLTHADGYIVAKGQDREAAFATKPWMEQILNAIGLRGDGAGGQG